VNEKDQRKLVRIERMIGKEIPKLPLPEELGEAPAFNPTVKTKRSFKPNRNMKRPNRPNRQR
jgi:ATP-dependent RNA helicase RhlE